MYLPRCTLRSFATQSFNNPTIHSIFNSQTPPFPIQVFYLLPPYKSFPHYECGTERLLSKGYLCVKRYLALVSMQCKVDPIPGFFDWVSTQSNTVRSVYITHHTRRSRKRADRSMDPQRWLRNTVGDADDQRCCEQRVNLPLRDVG